MSKQRTKRTLLPLYQPSDPPPQARSFQTPTRSRSFQIPGRTRSCDSLVRSTISSPLSSGSTSSISRKDNKSSCLPKFSPCHSSSSNKIMAATPTTPQQEQLPDAASLPFFFMPNFLGIVFAYGLEFLQVERMLRNIVSTKAHPYALLGLGVFCIANTNSYLGGSVVIARIQYGVKLPNLYATERDKNGIAFNCVQRGHQNFLETYAQVVLSVLFVAALRPHIAGMMLIIVAIARVFYARSYRTDIPSRIGPLLIAMLTMSIGVGYGFLLGLSAFGFQLMDSK